MRSVRLLGMALLSLLAAGSARADQITAVPLATNNLVYDPGTQQIYASVPSSAGLNGNSITRLDPSTGNLIASVFVGSEPNQLALASDRQSLFVGLDGASAIRRYEISTQTAGQQFPAALSGQPPSAPVALAAVPGSPDSVVASLALGGNTAAVFDNGVPRPQWQRLYGITYGPIAYSDSPARLYSVAYPNVLERLTVSPGGIGAVTNLPGVLAAILAPAQMLYRNGVIYTSDGDVVDPETGTRLGVFTWDGSATAVEVDPATNRAFFLTEKSGEWSVKVYDLQNFTPVGSISLPITGYGDQPSGLLRWGTDGLALRTSTAVYLIHTSLIPTAAVADLRVSVVADRTTVAGANPLTYTITVQNTGATAASHVVLTDTLDNAAAYVSGDASQGTLAAHDLIAVATLGDLAPGASATVHVTVKPSLAGTTQNTAVVTAAALDSNPADNTATLTTAVTAPTIADLTGSWSGTNLTYALAMGPHRGVLSSTLTLQNVGLAASGKCVATVYLSSSPTVDAFSAKVKDLKIGKLQKGGHKAYRLKLRVSLPAGDPPYYLIAVIDSGNAVAEASEQNNYVVAGPF